MESFIQNVKDIDADRLRSLEHVVGQNLNGNQQVAIRVVDIGTEPSEHIRNEALARAAEIARQARANAAAQGVSEEEVEAAIEEAIRHARQRKRNG